MGPLHSVHPAGELIDHRGAIQRTQETQEHQDQEENNHYLSSKLRLFAFDNLGVGDDLHTGR